ncbi:hypothetical protein C5167_005699 [Papaver somniferum]|uniref:Uncharacterized protein n=1 Tax=Papaver somniferum TaxID=3469 RepID=A0A4Y7JBB2_PAPSO|nr:hypothetical protein C5167_005699 [Papaver somniferum]
MEPPHHRDSRMKEANRKQNEYNPGIAKLIQQKEKKKAVEEEEIEAAEKGEITAIEKLFSLQGVCSTTLPTFHGLENGKKKNVTPPSRPPRFGDKLLTATHIGALVDPGKIKIRELNNSQPPPKLNDSDETPDEDQSILSVRRHDDDVERTPAAGGSNNDDDDGDQDMPPIGGGNDDGDKNNDKYREGKIVEEEEEEREGEEGVEKTGNNQQTQDTTTTKTGKKNMVITKPVDSHMPPSHLKVTLEPGEPPQGTPEDDGYVLFG